MCERQTTTHLGELQSVHRVSPFGVWALLLVVVPLLIAVMAGAVYTFTSVRTEDTEGVADKVLTFSICLIAPSLLLVLIGRMWIDDFRKWLATRTAELKIYQHGFTYETKGEIESCHWKEIKTLHTKMIEVKRGPHGSRDRIPFHINL